MEKSPFEAGSQQALLVGTFEPTVQAAAFAGIVEEFLDSSWRKGTSGRTDAEASPVTKERRASDLKSIFSNGTIVLTL
jgi:hypothetical protein